MTEYRHRFISGIAFTLSQLFVILLTTGSVAAETKYVSDVLVINIRSSIKSPYTVIGSVYSDDPLKIIRTEEKYYFVETEDGKQGWISQQYVKDTLPKSLLLEQLSDEKEELQRKLDTAIGELASLKEKFTAIPSSGEAEQFIDERNTLRTQVSELKEQVAKLMSTPDFKATEEFSRIKEAHTNLIAQKAEQDKENKQNIDNLNATIKKLQDYKGSERAKIEQLTAENLELKKKSNVYWFLAGSAVFLFGIITGKISRPRKKKRSLY
ncbi:SH3 domain-containing protein [Desulfopila sp. IMCC35008]|uniref:SH3 domain-containing protein n=1 Tax=Desulfopila sp. IMCC35008 TaxID=2653858 RepID=UPI0013D03599|nr:SH3 domain-containing protein [Desulfopila sp. IMCC35008]